MNFIEMTLSDGRMKVHVEGDTQVELFQALADAQEVFSNLTCGSCKSDQVRFVVRTVDENNFHEMKCHGCGARLSFGQNKKGGGLFPKRKIKKPDGTEVFDKECMGWVKWVPPTSNGQQEAPKTAVAVAPATKTRR